MSKFTLLFAGLALAVVISPYAGADVCNLKQADECAKDIIMYSENTVLPIDPQEIAKECEKGAKAAKCLQDIAEGDCQLSDSAKRVFKQIIEGAENERVHRCDPSHKTGQDYAKFVPCLNKVGNKLQQCEKHLAAEAEAAVKAPVDERVGRACCLLAKVGKCLHDVSQEACSVEHARFIDDMVNGTAGAAIGPICAGFKADACEKYDQLEVSEQTKYQTALLPFIELLSF
ncbi:uncharacterized protein LOC111254194 isoform X1 [Varroa destructor]|uniref:Uncharacterized protein n=1 Tax=Varroa destructor TaxID=109461 RepID=A0A7M7MJB5_VARDE|nr:uncharacterized protein LOC111254194 isoform X1 [Varroa destructor]